MPSIRHRVYTYLMLVAIPIFPVLYINSKMSDTNILNKDIRSILSDTKMKLVCNVETDSEYFMLPNLTSFLGKDKICTCFGIDYDYWAVHTYEVKIRISDYPIRDAVPKGEYIIIGEPIFTDIDQDGKITYIIPIKQPQELVEVLVSSYTDNCVGIFGEFSYLFDRVNSKGLTMKEFNRIMVCINKIIYPPKMENKNGK
jgi:hypothetical protein